MEMDRRRKNKIANLYGSPLAMHQGFESAHGREECENIKTFRSRGD